MDIAKLKRTRGRLSGFIMGLIASIYGALFAMIISLSIVPGNQTLLLVQYERSVATAVVILLLITVAISVVGASLIRAKRIVGGIIIICASVPLFVISVIDPDAFSILIVTSLVCIAAGVLALIPLSDSHLQKLAVKHQYKSHMAAFVAQQQAQPDNETISVTPVDGSVDAQMSETEPAADKDDATQW